VLLLRNRDGGIGMNLKYDDNVIILEYEWNKNQDLQEKEREKSIGKKNEVRVMRLMKVN
jgi:SNF2 family DNA or RNA helicase